MLFSFLIASVSAGSTSTTPINRCVNGAVDHEFLVTLKPPAANSNGRRLDTTEDKLSFLQGWVDQYTGDQHDSEGFDSNGNTRRKLEANSSRVSNCTPAWIRQKVLAYISNTLGHGTKHIKDMENV